jgi:hypothetical protein
MAVRIAPHSAKLQVTKRPHVNDPEVDDDTMSFTGTEITADGEVTLIGGPGDSPAGWTLGFIQAQWIETNWLFYRGQHNTDGSIFIQRARPPARPNQACRDVVNGSPLNRFFYSILPADNEIDTGVAGDVFPLTLSVSHFDEPSDSAALVEDNSLTGKPNFLAESQMEFHFCTILSLQDPAGRFQHLLSFYWNMHWQASYHPTTFDNPPDDFRINVLRAGTSANVGGIIQGNPTDRRFIGVLTSPQGQSCNQVAGVEVAGPNRHEAAVWKNFDVRRA